jgi:carbon storage regulator
MLMLTRKRGERIRIGEAIEVVVTEMRRGHVRLGISAPPGVPIFREEIYQAIVSENRRAARPARERLPHVERALHKP